MAIAGIHQLYFGTNLGKTFVFEEGTYSDDGNPIALRLKTKNYYLDAPNQRDDIQYIQFYSDQPQGTIATISFDGGDYETLGSLQEYREPQRFDVWNTAYNISIGLDEISTNNIKIKGFNVVYEPQPEVL